MAHSQLYHLLLQACKEGTFRRLNLVSNKTTIKKVSSPKRGDFYQLAERKGAQEFHKNLSQQELLKWADELPLSLIEKSVLHTSEHDIHFHKEGKFSMKSPTLKEMDLNHDRKKNHLLDKEALPPYFKALGITRDKQLQIEKFLREVEAILPALKEKKSIRAVDFGCGKAYLTFALYDYLSQKFEVSLTGIDLKKEVMENCQKLADELGFKGLRFQVGRMENLEETRVDLAVALHACDTATDSALAKGVSLHATVILAAPCCQHEFYTQIKSDTFNPLLKHGILKERFASIATDAVRGALLESVGYEVKIVEFIDAAHTPKNILIRAIYTGNKGKNRAADYNTFKEFLHLAPALELLLRSQSDVPQ